jgi:hypothetical protein
MHPRLSEDGLKAVNQLLRALDRSYNSSDSLEKLKAEFASISAQWNRLADHLMSRASDFCQDEENEELPIRSIEGLREKIRRQALPAIPQVNPSVNQTAGICNNCYCCIIL